MLLYQSIFYNFFKTIGYLLIAIAMSVLVGMIYSVLLLMIDGPFVGISFWIMPSWPVISCLHPLLLEV